MNELTPLMEQVADTALENLREHGHVYPVALLIARDGQRIVAGMYWQNEEEKDTVLARVRETARTAAVAVIYVLETWLTRQPKPGVPPSEDPDREEAIALVAFTPATTKAMVIPFTRDQSGAPVPLPREWVEHSALSSKLDPWPDRVPPS